MDETVLVKYKGRELTVTKEVATILKRARMRSRRATEDTEIMQRTEDISIRTTRSILNTWEAGTIC